MKRLVMMLLVLVAIGGTTEVSAQSWLDQLGKKVKEKAKDKVEQKILQKTDQVIEKAFDKTEEAVKGNGGNQTGVPQEAAPQQPVQQAPAVQETPVAPVQPEPVQPQAPSLEMTYAKSDFVAGDEIIFDDPMDNEQLGEFPSQWELIEGVAEVVSINGKKAILISEWGTKICPLMKDPLNFLGDVFTVEYDLMFPETEGDHTWLKTKFMKVEGAWMKSPICRQYGLYFDLMDTQEARRRRVERLSEERWQCVYLAVFVRLLEEREPSLASLPAADRVKLLATAYNRDFEASPDSLRKWSSDRTFHLEILPTRNTKYHSYADIALEWYEYINR